MIIGLDARKAWDGGIGTYIRGLMAALADGDDGNAYVALLDPRDRLPAWPARVRVAAVRAGKYSLAEHVVVPRAARRAGVELLHAPHYTLPLAWRGPAVVTIHDLIHIRFARHYPPGASLYARAMARAAARRARRVIVDSNVVRDDVVALLDVPASRVHVIPLGVSPVFTRRAPEEVAAFRGARGLPARYVLYVGARKRHKNLGLLLEALGRIAPPERPPLVISGPAWDARDPLAEAAGRFGVASAIHFAADLPDDDALALLYSGAALYAQPSLGEGFGLPPLEAMACGTPVVAARAGALPETLGTAARLLPPEDAAAWAEAIVSLLRNGTERTRLAAAGVAHAGAFTWERTAGLTRSVYAEAMAG